VVIDDGFVEDEAGLGRGLVKISAMDPRTPMAYKGVMLSMCSCHLGGLFGGFGLPIFLRCRISITSSPAPMASFAASAASDGAVLGGGSLLPVTSTVTAITIVSDRGQPKMNAAPFRTPPFEARTRLNAVSVARQGH
jgi:hypothetical protein